LVLHHFLLSILLSPVEVAVGVVQLLLGSLAKVEAVALARAATVLV
jgi:hypothetical protein